MVKLDKRPQLVTQSKSDPSVVRFRYLDGLRGIAALYVVLFHAYQEADPDLSGNQFSFFVQFVTRSLTNGRFSVAVFIVLSGYCLMLPVVHSSNGQLRGGFLNYMKRRARRILPPYYAALMISLLLVAIIPSNLYPRMGFHWQFAQPSFTVGVLTSHLALLHNLRPDWIYKINGPMWSVATEWQIYFVFAGLLLPVWRILGLRAAVAIALMIGVGLHSLLGAAIDEASPWYLGLFAFGMAGAVVGFSAKKSLVQWKEQMPWNSLGTGLGVLAVAIRLWNHTPPNGLGRMFEDSLTGSAIACLLIAWTDELMSRPNDPSTKRLSLVVRLFQSRWAVSLGTFSYSLYLIHLPMLGVFQLLISFLGLSPTETLLVLLTIATPFSIFVAYRFHLIFEQRFISSRRS